MEREFSLEAAREMVPRLRQLLESARTDLGDLAARLKSADEAFLEAEWDLRERRLAEGTPDLRFDADRRWKRAAHKLQALKDEVRERTQAWLADIQETGALLRDLNHGLVDFPGRSGDLEVFWCWHLGEETISHWHGRHEGFASRKPLGNIPTRG